MDKHHDSSTHSGKRPVGASQNLDGQIGLSAKAAAAALQISVRSLKRLEERGLIKPCKALRHKIYSRRQLELFLEEHS